MTSTGPARSRPESDEHHGDHCGQTFTAKRSDAKYCSPLCRTAAHRDHRQENKCIHARKLARRDAAPGESTAYDVRLRRQRQAV